ncbi:MAG: SpoIIE family protein phosphatase [Coriobacteriia bacterium]|nr:SpoIIE family protein phosphatase [Coriobacteriia bacterium]
MKARERFTLTNRLLVLAALIVVSTTVLLIGTSAAGVYNMASRQTSARHAAYGDVLVARIGSRIAAIHAEMRSVALDPALGSDQESIVRSALAGIALDDTGFIEGAVLLRESTATPVAWPGETLDESSLSALGALDRDEDFGAIVWIPASPDSRGGLWAVHAVPAPDGATRLLAVRVRTSLIEAELASTTELPGGPLAVVFDGEGTPVFANAPLTGIETSEIRFTPDDTLAGRGRVSIEGTETVVGGYSEIPDPHDLEWRVAILEPESRAWRDTWMALRPGLLGWVAALGIALAGALSVVNRSTRPLRQLERRARAIGAGDRVEPEPVTADDDIGRLLDAFNSVVTRFNRLTDSVELLARTDDREDLFGHVAASVAHMYDPADVDVLLLSEEGDLDLAAARGALEVHGGIHIGAPRSGWLAECLATGLPVSAAYDPEDALFSLHGEGVSAGLVAPLWAGGDCIGLVAVVRGGRGAFTEGERETLRSFVAQAAVALQNARLFDNERRSRREAEALREIAERAASPVGVEETLRFAAASEADLLGFDHSDIVLLDDPALYGLEDGEIADNPLWIDAWQSGSAGHPGVEPVYVRIDDATPEVSAALMASGALSALMTPLLCQGRSAGLLVCTALHVSLVPGVKRLGLARTIGAEASLALENAYLFQAAKNRADNLETIFRISNAVGSSLQTRVVLNRVLDVVQKILSADAVMLMTYDARRKLITVPMARGVLHRDMLEIEYRPGEDVPGRVFETREPERYDRIGNTDTRLLNSASAQGLSSLLAVPLLARGRSIGVLVVFARSEGVFSSEEMDLLRTFAAQAALAIDTAELFSREHHVASVLQASILPSGLPHVPGLDTSSVYLPAGTDADIGGDYYDLFVTPGGPVTFAIGDVCGKGVVAATKTSMIKYAVRGMVAAGVGPARILEEINRMLLEAGDATSIVTLWVGQLDMTSGTLRYADGGHPPALLRDGASDHTRIERLGTTGALLGAVEDTSWDEVEVTLEEGATLLLYTDGVTEARNGPQFFGEGRVRRALRPGGTAGAVTQRLLSMVQRFSGGELRDDAAVLAIRIDAGGRSVSEEERSGM